MKISPLAADAGGSPGTDIGNVNIGSTASAEKLAAAKALAAGQAKPEGIESLAALLEQDRREKSIRRIKMKTNASPERYLEQAAEAAATEAETPVSTISDESGQTAPAVESTQPISPQFAALARQRRELQVMKQELAKEKAAMEQSKSVNAEDVVSKADLIANPLKIFDLGVTHDQLTEAILANASGINPEIKSLKEELKRVKDDVNQTLTTREAQQEEQALTQMLDEAESLAKEGEDFELIRTENAYAEVLNKIYTTYKKTGKVLKVQDVMQEIETKLLERNLRFANINKVRSKLTSETVQEQPQSEGKQMKTLTSRDGATIPLSAKARAMLAFTGQLRK